MRRTIRFIAMVSALTSGACFVNAQADRGGAPASASQATVEELRKRLAQCRKEKERLKRRLEKTVAEAGEERKRFENLIAEKEDEITRWKFRYEREVKMYRKMLKELRYKIDPTLRERVLDSLPPYVTPDGRVTAVGGGKVTLDFGFRDGVRVGFLFGVYERSGIQRGKAIVSVKEVGEKESTAIFVGEGVCEDHVLKGDAVWSPLYVGGRPSRLVLVGEKPAASTLRLEELKEKLSEFGVVVSDRLTTDTDYAVLIEKYEKDPLYEKARRLAVTFLRESDIVPFVLAGLKLKKGAR